MSRIDKSVCNRYAYLLKNILFIAVMTVTVLFISTCTPRINRNPFDLRKCLEKIPNRVKGLKIISGPRSKQSIIRDMVPVVCSGRALFMNMNKNGKEINKGYILFKILVEYTGEVNKVSVEEKTIQSDEFLRRVSDFIMDKDFVFWGEDERDTVFLYPIHFDQ